MYFPYQGGPVPLGELARRIDIRRVGGRRDDHVRFITEPMRPLP